MPQINIITSPRVSLISSQTIHYPEHMNWRSDSSFDSDVIPEVGGRLCYLSFGDDCGLEGGHKTIKGRTNNQDYVHNILESAHGSVLEHAVFGILIEGVSRSLTHELVRHRAGFAYSQVSQRYVDESQVSFVLPPEIQPDTSAYDLWVAACEHNLRFYVAILEDLNSRLESADVKKTYKIKRARQAARSILPNCAETKILVTGNARAWRHFVEMRGTTAADLEIRRLAVEVVGVIAPLAPAVFQDIEIVELPDGTQGVQSKHPKT